MTVVATVIVLGVLIFVHELGHFWAAKLVGIEVQRFSIGLGPKIFGFQKGETEYVLSWIPLGGYVKMGGMDDEVMERVEGGASEAVRTPGPRDFDAKPIWARTFVISAGVIMNMIFALAVFVGVNAVYGVRELDETRVGLVDASALPRGAESLAEIPIGATIERIGDRSVAHWGDVRDGVLDASSGQLVIETSAPAGTYEVELSADTEQRRQLLASFRWWVPSELGDINPGSPAADAGLQKSDRVLSVNGVGLQTWDEFVLVIRANPGEDVELVLDRDGTRLVRTVTPEDSTEDDPETGDVVHVGRVGVWAPLVDSAYEPVPIARAVVLGYQETEVVTRLILGFLRDLVTGGVSPRSVGSIVTIGAASGAAAEAGPSVFLRFMALFSVNLAILNLLPIPILDGGHLVFLGIEAVRGRALSIEQRLRWSNFGFLIIMGIMVWALSNDILRLFGL
jgi:regulator of sigma E protease